MANRIIKIINLDYFLDVFRGVRAEGVALCAVLGADMGGGGGVQAAMPRGRNATGAGMPRGRSDTGPQCHGAMPRGRNATEMPRGRNATGPECHRSYMLHQSYGSGSQCFLNYI